MDEDKTLTKAPISDDFNSNKASPYEMLMRQSRKMGGVATRTYDVTKEFLKQDISSIHPDKILFGIKTVTKRGSTSSDVPEKGGLPESLSDTGDPKPDSVEDSSSEVVRAGKVNDAPTLALDPREGLRKIVRKSHQLLASAQTVILPINLFPDSITVDRTKVTITKKTFFWSSSVISIRIEDVLNIACSTGPIFGSLTISSRVMNSTDHYEIDYFWRKDALYLKQLIQGYVIAQHNQIETSHLNRRELIQTLLDLGSDTDY